MRVRADRDFRTYVGGVLLRASAGSEWEGAAARAMLDTRCPVTRLDEPDEEPAETIDETPDEPDEEPAAAPDGNVGEILDWVGSDPDRAKIALDAERAREHPRSTLVKQLTAIG